MKNVFSFFALTALLFSIPAVTSAQYIPARNFRSYYDPEAALKVKKYDRLMTSACVVSVIGMLSIGTGTFLVVYDACELPPYGERRSLTRMEVGGIAGLALGTLMIGGSIYLFKQAKNQRQLILDTSNNSIRFRYRF